jgi:selenocysteine lyase/cysteine desulfurase
VDACALRDEFPVLRRVAYLNAGTDGPLPTRAVRAAQEELDRELDHGRSRAHFERRSELTASLRGAYAAALGADAADVALTTCTSEGVALVVGGLALRPGQEILTSTDEHPGLLGALQAARDLAGVSIRTVPFAELAAAVGPRTALVACSHVNWMNGSVAPTELAGVDVPVLLDGAQGLGAVPVELDSLGCDAYAASGQKWLCGPDGSGALYVTPALRERIGVTRRGYPNLADAPAGLESGLQPDARRLDTLSLNAETLACARAAVGVLEGYGWRALHARSRELAALLADRLASGGRIVAPRGPTTLVAFESADPELELARLTDAGVIMRGLPGTPWLRASVGAWNDEHDVQRLLDIVTPG